MSAIGFITRQRDAAGGRQRDPARGFAAGHCDRTGSQQQQRRLKRRRAERPSNAFSGTEEKRGRNKARMQRDKRPPTLRLHSSSSRCALSPLPLASHLSVSVCRTFLKPMSLAYSRKHRRQMLRWYLRISPCVLLHTRLHRQTQQQQQHTSAAQRSSGSSTRHAMRTRQQEATPEDAHRREREIDSAADGRMARRPARRATAAASHGQRLVAAEGGDSCRIGTAAASPIRM